MENYTNLCDRIAEILGNSKISNLRKEYKSISGKYREERANSSVIVTSENEVVSYISSRMGETATIVDNVLSRLDEIDSLCGNVLSVLDVGSGTGACLWALDNYIANANIIAVERESQMIKYSKMLASDLLNNIEYVQSDILASRVKSLSNCDLVIESFVLNEMEENERMLAVDLMCDKTDKYLVLIEPGTPKSYQNMMKIRNYIVSKGFNLVLPCPHGCECGLKGDYCNFSVRVSRTKTAMQIKGGMLNYEDEKFFYLVFRKGDDNNLKFNSTVIRKPVYRKGCVDLKLCNKDGSIETKTITKSNKENYKLAKDLKHGDVVSFNK